MSNFAAFEQAIASVLSLRGVQRCIVATADEDSLQSVYAEVLPRTVLVTARDLARRAIAQRIERQSENASGYVILTQRFDDVAVSVIGDESLDHEEVHRKLNVIAIRARVAISKEGPGPLASSLRDDYVAVAGPLSGMVFDRAFEELRRTRRAIDAAALRPFAESLAESLTPPTNHQLRDRFEATMKAWGPESATTRAAPPIMKRELPPPPIRRPTTVPRMAAVQGVVRELIGPLGDLLVQRALESTMKAPPTDDGDAERLITTIAAQLPQQHRERFLHEGRAAVAASQSAPTLPADARAEPDLIAVPPAGRPFSGR